MAGIRSRQEPAIRHMLTEVPGRGDAAGEGRRQLGVDDEAH